MRHPAEILTFITNFACSLCAINFRRIWGGVVNTPGWFDVEWPILICRGNQKLTIDMGFKEIKNFSKIFCFDQSPEGQRCPKSEFFWKYPVFCFIFFIISISMPCHILLERTFKTEQNGIYFIKIFSYNEYIATLILPPISWLVAKTKSVKNS